MERAHCLPNLQSKLISMARDPILMDQALSAAAPLLEAAAAGRLAFGVADGLSGFDPLIVVNDVFGASAANLLPVPLAGRLLPAEWMNEAAETAAANGLAEAVAASVDRPIWDTLSPANSAKWADETNRRFASAIWRQVGSGLELAYAGAAGAALGRRLAVGAWGLACWLFAKALWNEPEAVARLARLAPLLCRFYPVGAKAGEPGTWLFLTA